MTTVLEAIRAAPRADVLIEWAREDLPGAETCAVFVCPHCKNWVNDYDLKQTADDPAWSGNFACVLCGGLLHRTAEVSQE